jgi:hypothetical protein
MRAATAAGDRGNAVRILLQKLLLPAAFLVLTALAASPCVRAAPAPATRSFASPEQAASALAAATRAHDEAALRAIFGPGSEILLSSGDRYADEEQQRRFADAYDAGHKLSLQGEGRMQLEVGENSWPLPIPIVERNGGWMFDTKAGADELVDRRIGRNELAAIRTSLAYADAQRDYFARKQQETGTGFYADRLASTPERQDGLYWPTGPGVPESPLRAAGRDGIGGRLSRRDQGRAADSLSGILLPHPVRPGPECVRRTEGLQAGRADDRRLRLDRMAGQLRSLRHHDVSD